MTTAALPTRAAPIQFVPRSTSRNAAPPTLTTLCSTCHLKDLCLPCGMSAPTVERLDGLHFGRRRVKAGEPLSRAGDAFQAIYAVREKKELYIRADQGVPYGKVMQAMSAAKLAGVSKLAMLSNQVGSGDKKN